VALAGGRHRIGEIPAMGSLSPLPSTRSARNGWSGSCGTGSAIRA
jgi:hypothetical protein